VACFTVTDNGRGFDPRHRHRILEKFHRVDDACGPAPRPSINPAAGGWNALADAFDPARKR